MPLKRDFGRLRRPASLSPAGRSRMSKTGITSSKRRASRSRSRSPHTADDEFYGQDSEDDDADYETDNDDGYMNTCARCQEGGLVVCCSRLGCPIVMHTNCAGLSGVPSGDWYCDICKAQPIATTDSKHTAIVDKSDTCNEGKSVVENHGKTVVENHPNDRKEEDEEEDKTGPTVVAIGHSRNRNPDRGDSCVESFRDFLCASDEKMWITTYGRKLWNDIQLHLAFGRASSVIHAGNQLARSQLLLTDGKMSDYPTPTGRLFDLRPTTTHTGTCELCQLKRSLTFKLLRGGTGVGYVGGECATRLRHLQQLLKLIFESRVWFASKSNAAVCYSATEVPKRLEQLVFAIDGERRALKQSIHATAARYKAHRH